MAATRSSARKTRSSTQRASAKQQYSSGACFKKTKSIGRVSKKKQQKATKYGLEAIEEHTGQGRGSQLTETVLPSIEFPDTTIPGSLRDTSGRIHQPSPFAGPSHLFSIPETPQNVQPSPEVAPAIKRERRSFVPQTPEIPQSSEVPILPDYNFSLTREDSGELDQEDGDEFEREWTRRGYQLKHVPRTPARRVLEESLIYFYHEKRDEVVIPKLRSWTYYGLLRVGYLQHYLSSPQRDFIPAYWQGDNVFFPKFSTRDPVIFAEWCCARLRDGVVAYF